jgi:hypothetical protein
MKLWLRIDFLLNPLFIETAWTKKNDRGYYFCLSGHNTPLFKKHANRDVALDDHEWVLS